MARNDICIEDIQLAIKGDSLAMQNVVRYFSPYIKDLSLIIRQTDSDYSHFHDDDKVEAIESHLMDAIMKFDFSRIDKNIEAAVEEFVMDTDTGFA